MMKKLIAILMAIALCACLFVGCSGTLEIDDAASSDSSFVVVENGVSYIIAYHKDTRVMYSISCSSYNCGSFCLLVNPDGTPMIWEGK
jgi:hypothetical protein